jgi:hypothetical protein
VTVEFWTKEYYDADLSYEDSDTRIWDTEDTQLILMYT